MILIQVRNDKKVVQDSIAAAQDNVINRAEDIVIQKGMQREITINRKGE